MERNHSPLAGYLALLDVTLEYNGMIWIPLGNAHDEVVSGVVNRLVDVHSQITTKRTRGAHQN